MAGLYRMVLVAGLLVAATGGTAAAQHTASTCPQITDQRGDVVFKDNLGYPGDVSAQRTAGWNEASVDILSVEVSADRQDVTTTVQVAGLVDDPVHGNVWRVWLAVDASHPRESLATVVHRVTGGDTFTVHYEWWGGKGPLPSGGPVGSTSGYTEDVATTGSIDVARGLIRTRIPLTLLDHWHIKRSARIWDLRAHAGNAAGVAVGPVIWDQMFEGDASDDAFAFHAVSQVQRLNAPGC